jgi:hypothetical protein
LSLIITSSSTASWVAFDWLKIMQVHVHPAHLLSRWWKRRGFERFRQIFWISPHFQDLIYESTSTHWWQGSWYSKGLWSSLLNCSTQIILACLTLYLVKEWTSLLSWFLTLDPSLEKIKQNAPDLSFHGHNDVLLVMSSLLATSFTNNILSEMIKDITGKALGNGTAVATCREYWWDSLGEWVYMEPSVKYEHVKLSYRIICISCLTIQDPIISWVFTVKTAHPTRSTLNCQSHRLKTAFTD